MAETRTVHNRAMWFGWVTFAAVLLVVVGLLNILEGLVALLQNQVAFIDGDSLVVVDLTGLGVVMLVFGGLLLAAGIGLLARNTAARIVAITVVALHALTQIGSLGAYPVWALLMITLDVIILFALTVHWVDLPGEVEAQLPPSGTHRADRDMQHRGAAFPVNSPTSPGRGAPAHAAPDMPGQQGQSGQPMPVPHNPQMPAGNQPMSGEQQYHEQNYQQYQSPYQQPMQQPMQGPAQGPNAGPYPPGRPSSPAHAAPTSGYGTGAI